MHAVDKYLKAALEEIKGDNCQLWNEQKSAIKKAYKGYVSSFGTIVKQSGLLPAAVLFGKANNERSEEDKAEITRLLYQLIKAVKPDLVREGNENFIDFAVSNQHIGRARQEVLYATIALKLAIRTFKIES